MPIDCGASFIDVSEVCTTGKLGNLHMFSKFVTAATALTVSILASSVSATTVEATFAGTAFDGFGAFNPVTGIDIEGADASFSLIGDSAAVGTPTSMVPVGSVEASGSAARYDLEGIALSLPSISFEESSSEGFIWVVDGLVFGNDVFDALLARNSNVGLGGFDLGYLALFQQNTFSGVGLEQAIQLGLASAPVVLQVADYSLADNGFRANLQVAGIVPVDPPAVIAPVPSAVPLPASMPLLLAGLGGVMALRSRRRTS